MYQGMRIQAEQSSGTLPVHYCKTFKKNKTNYLFPLFQTQNAVAKLKTLMEERPEMVSRPIDFLI